MVTFSRNCCYFFVKGYFWGKWPSRIAGNSSSLQTLIVVIRYCPSFCLLVGLCPACTTTRKKWSPILTKYEFCGFFMSFVLYLVLWIRLSDSVLLCSPTRQPGRILSGVLCSFFLENMYFFLSVMSYELSVLSLSISICLFLDLLSIICVMCEFWSVI